MTAGRWTPNIATLRRAERRSSYAGKGVPDPCGYSARVQASRAESPDFARGLDLIERVKDPGERTIRRSCDLPLWRVGSASLAASRAEVELP